MIDTDQSDQEPQVIIFVRVRQSSRRYSPYEYVTLTDEGEL